LNARKILVSLALLSLSSAAALAADVEVKAPWVRGTVSGQQATGAFMEITSKSGAVLVGAASPAAGITEIHEMKMDWRCHAACAPSHVLSYRPANRCSSARAATM
jgi:copper(I)-binding protein